MRLNNGTTKAGASEKRSSSRTTPRRDVDANRLQVSDDLTSPSEDSDADDVWEPPGTRLRNRIVNDLRNGRSGTPASTHSESSVRTHKSNNSERPSMTASTASRRRAGSRRREVCASENEPHPYGLESREVTTLLPPQTTRASSTLTRGHQVQASTSASYITDSESMIAALTSHTQYHEGGGGSYQQHLVNRNVGETCYTQTVHNANNNNKATSYLSRLFTHGTEETPYSSDSEASVHENNIQSDEETSAPTSSIFATTWHYVKMPISYLCSCVYLLLMGTFYFEKWCLSGKRGGNTADYRSVDMNGVNFGTSEQEYDGSNRSRNELFDISSSSPNNNRSTLIFFSSFVGSSARNLNQFEINNSRSHSKVSWINQFRSWLNVGGSSNQNGYEENLWLGYLKNLGRKLMWLLLVIIPLLILWFYGGCLYHGAAFGLTYGSSAGSSALGSAISALTSNVGMMLAALTASTPTEKAALPMVPPISSPSVNIKQIESANLDEMNVLRQESKETLTALKLTQESIDALKIKIGEMELTLQEHESRLNAHDDAFKVLESEISKIIAAMKAASTKEKSVEQIIDEVLSVNVGETTDGTPVSLKSMFSVLKEKDDRKRISVEIETKLRSLSVDIGKLQDTFHETTENVGSFSADLNVLNTRITNMESIVAEHRNANVEVEMDIEKVKELVVPVLTKEIEKKVAVSCESRKCPESSPFHGLSVEDIELMINRAILKYDADKTGLPDLALESAGGSILSTRCTKSSELRNSVISYWGFRLWSPPNTPRTIIQPGVVPGECWAFEGSVGDVVIKLAVPAVVTAFTMEHIPKTISRYGHIDSAPKHFKVLGLESEHDTEDVHDYGTFTYTDNEEPLQYFPVSNATTKPYPIVELKILSNHGNMKHTCIYRFRVHGAIDLSRSHGTVKRKSIEIGVPNSE